MEAGEGEGRKKEWWQEGCCLLKMAEKMRGRVMEVESLSNSSVREVFFNFFLYPSWILSVRIFVILLLIYMLIEERKEKIKSVCVFYVNSAVLSSRFLA